MFRRMLSITFILFYMSHAVAAVVARADRLQVKMGETVNLTVRTTHSGAGSPDWNVLSKHFRVLGTSVNSSMQIINGKTSTEVEWVATLLPRHLGNLVIPAIPVGQEKTMPLTVSVSKEAQKIQPGESAKAFLEVEVEPKEVYEKQQLVYVVKLFTSMPLANGSLEPPSSDQITLQSVGKDQQYAKLKAGKQYSVVERRYLIFPQHAGDITVESPYFSGLLMKQGGVSSFQSMYRDVAEPIHLQAKPITIKVKPKPTSYTGQWWLPAEKVSVSEAWSTDISQWHVGEPVTRTITLRAVGVSAEQLPQYTVDGGENFKVYPDKPQLTTTIENGKVVGELQLKMAIVPSHAGSLAIPQMDLPWWDVTKNTQQTASLPAQQLQIHAALVETVPQSEGQVNAAETHLQLAVGQSWFWPITLSVVLIGWVLTVIAWWYSRRTKRLEAKPRLAKEKAASAKHLYKDLRKACEANDASQAATLLLAWAKVNWPNRQFYSLSDIALCWQSADFQLELRKLEMTIYGQPGSGVSVWDGQAFWQVLTQAQSKVKKTRVVDELSRDVLPPLHPKQAPE